MKTAWTTAAWPAGATYRTSQCGGMPARSNYACTKREAASSRRVTAPPRCCIASIKTAVATTKQRPAGANGPARTGGGREDTGTIADFKQAYCWSHRPSDSSGMPLLPSTRSRRGGSGFFVCRRGMLRIIAGFAETAKPHGFGTQAGHSVDESWSVGRCPGLSCRFNGELVADLEKSS